MSADINSKNRPLKIVLVDDDKIVLQVHADILKTIGHQPFSFEQPHDAADYLKQHDENINLIITDYKMGGFKFQVQHAQNVYESRRTQA